MKARKSERREGKNVCLCLYILLFDVHFFLFQDSMVQMDIYYQDFALQPDLLLFSVSIYLNKGVYIALVFKSAKPLDNLSTGKCQQLYLSIDICILCTKRILQFPSTKITQEALVSWGYYRRHLPKVSCSEPETKSQWIQNELTCIFVVYVILI